MLITCFSYVILNFVDWITIIIALTLLMRIVMSFVWRKFSSVGREEWCNKMKNGQKLKLGDVPWTPQEISKKYKRQSLGMPKASPLHQQKAPGHFSTRYIFIPSCDMCYPWSVFTFCCVFTFNKVGSHHSCLLWSETRSTALHIYFGVRHAPLFCMFILEWDTLHCYAFCVGERHAPLLHLFEFQ